MYFSHLVFVNADWHHDVNARSLLNPMVGMISVLLLLVFAASLAPLIAGMVQIRELPVVLSRNLALLDSLYLNSLI